MKKIYDKLTHDLNKSIPATVVDLTAAPILRDPSATIIDMSATPIVRDLAATIIDLSATPIDLSANPSATLIDARRIRQTPQPANPPPVPLLPRQLGSGRSLQYYLPSRLGVLPQIKNIHTR